MYPKNLSSDFDDTVLAKQSRRKKRRPSMIRMKVGTKEELLSLREGVEKFRAYIDAQLAAYDKRDASKRRKNRKRP